jgi:hypothetical protein
MQNYIKKSLARLMALTMAAALLIGASATASAAPRYPDIAGHWGEAAIERWSDYDVLHGTDQGLFDPDGELTVTQLAQILVNAFGYTASYTDELPGYKSPWGEDAVRKAIAAGALEAPEASLALTRELSAKIIAKAFGIAPVSGESKFADDSAISAGYKPYAAALGKLGFFNGNEHGEFTPERAFSRAQIMQVLDNAVTDIVKEDKAAESEKSVIVGKAGVTLAEGTIKGDLIIAQGVGDGDVTLDGVTVQGRLVIFGGGENSIHVKGKSNIPSVVVGKTFGQAARFVVESADASVGTVTIIAESKATVATTNGAEIAKIEVAPATEVTATGEVAAAKVTEATTVTIAAKAAEVEIAAENAALTISSGATIASLTVETKAAVTVASGATVTEATITASDVTVEGSGKVATVTVTGEDTTAVTVTVPDAKIENDSGAPVSVGGGKTVTAGGTGSVASSGNDSSAGTGGGGGGGGVIGDQGTYTLAVAMTSSATVNSTSTPSTVAGTDNFALALANHISANIASYESQLSSSGPTGVFGPLFGALRGNLTLVELLANTTVTTTPSVSLPTVTVADRTGETTIILTGKDDAAPISFTIAATIAPAGSGYTLSVAITANITSLTATRSHFGSDVALYDAVFATLQTGLGSALEDIGLAAQDAENCVGSVKTWWLDPATDRASMITSATGATAAALAATDVKIGAAGSAFTIGILGSTFAVTVS